MKRLLIIFVALLPLMVQSQTVDVLETTVSKNGMPFKIFELDGVRAFEYNGGNYYWLIEHYPLTRLTSSSMRLMRFDENMNRTSNQKIDELLNKDILQMSIADGKMYILVRDTKKLKEKGNVMLELSCCVVNLETMTVEEIKQLGQLDSKSQTSTACSDDKSFFVLAYQQGSGEMNSAHVWLYDNHFSLLWDRVVDCAILADVSVDDNGRVALASIGEHRVVMTYVDVEDYQMRSVDMGEYQAYSARVLRSDNNHIVVGGALLEMTGKNNDKALSVGYYGAAVDFRTGKANADCRLYSDEEIAVLQNLSVNKINSNNRGLRDVHIRAVTSTNYGGVMSQCMSYKQIVRTQTGSGTSIQIDFRALGLIVYGVDTTGHIAWHSSVRRNAQSSNYNLIHEVLLSRGDKCYLLFNENKKETKIINDVANRSKYTNVMQGNSPLSVYCIDGQGDVTKYTANVPKRTELNRLVERTDDTHVSLLVSSRKETKLLNLELK